jgi:hypothetical protein
MKFPTPIVRVDAHTLVMINFLSDRLGLYSFRVRVASSVLSKKGRKCAKPLDYVNLSYDFFSHIPLRYIGWSIAPMQLRREIQALLSVLSEKTYESCLRLAQPAEGHYFYLLEWQIQTLK